MVAHALMKMTLFMALGGACAQHCGSRGGWTTFAGVRAGGAVVGERAFAIGAASLAGVAADDRLPRQVAADRSGDCRAGQRSGSSSCSPSRRC
jgi:hypothetical protein